MDRTDVGDVRNPRGWLTTVVARICLDMLRARNARLEEPLDEATADRRTRCRRPGTGSGAGRFDRRGSARDPADPVACRAARVRAARYVRPAVRRDRTDRRPLGEHRRAARRRGHVAVYGARLPTQQRIWCTNACSSTRSSPRRATVTSMRCSRSSTTTWCCTSTQPRRAPPTTIRGAQAVAANARAFAANARFAEPALVDGAVGIVVAPEGRLALVLRFDVAGDKITEIDIDADPARLRRLSLAVLD